MARPRKNPAGPRYSPEHASTVLDHLIREGRVSHGDISRYMEIADLERRLHSLRSGGAAAPAASPAPRRRGRPPGRPAGRRPGRPGRPPASASAAPAAAATQKRGPGRPRKQRSAITPEQLASRQLQGRYLALVRQIPASKRGQYAKLAKEKGRESAIKEMQDAIKK